MDDAGYTMLSRSSLALLESPPESSSCAYSERRLFFFPQSVFQRATPFFFLVLFEGRIASVCVCVFFVLVCVLLLFCFFFFLVCLCYSWKTIWLHASAVFIDGDSSSEFSCLKKANNKRVFFFFWGLACFTFLLLFCTYAFASFFEKGEREREWELNINGNIIYLFIFVSIVTCFSFLLVMSKTFFFFNGFWTEGKRSKAWWASRVRKWGTRKKKNRRKKRQRCSFLLAVYLVNTTSCSFFFSADLLEYRR